MRSLDLLNYMYMYQDNTKTVYYSTVPSRRGPMGGAPYIGPRLGDGPIFEVSVSRLYSKERPGTL